MVSVVFLLISCQGIARAESGSTIEAVRDIPYAGTDNPRQCLDLFLPETRVSDAPLPVVVFIHGGAWRAGDKRGGFGRVRPFVETGRYAGVSVGYRLTNEAQWPAQIHDCKAAIRWIRANAEKHGLDPDRIGVWGTSAGGHLVAMLGTSANVPAMDGDLGPHAELSSAVTCVVDFFGPTDFLQMDAHRVPGSKMAHDPPDSPESILVGGAIQENPDRVATANPITYVTADDPPFLIMHGDNDRLVPIHQSEIFDKALQKAGVDVTFVPVKGAGHGLRGADVAHHVTTFFDTHLGKVATSKTGKPNIIYILADDLGYGHLGCYGQKEIATPSIDRMAVEGMKFTDHYAGSAVCAPSRCVLMTGLHTGHCYVRGNRPLPVEGNVPIPDDSFTVAELLKGAGYATAAMGKWGLGYPGSEGDPIKQGFDHFFGYNCQREAHSYYPDHLWRNDRKVMLKGNLNGQQKQYSHDLLTAEALNWLAKNHTRPFFLYLPYTIPHAKFQVPDLGQYKDKPWSDTKKAIAAMITRLDGDVGKILALVKSLGIDDSTLVIFVSDNGSAGGALAKEFTGSGPLRSTKGSMYEGGLRVPFIARWPGRIEPGTVSAHVSGFQDMMPTFADLAGIEVPVPTDGISMLPSLLGKGKQAEHDYLYWELGGKFAVRLGKWKAVVNKKGPLELYDLARDLGEQETVAAEHPDLVKKIEDIMKTAHIETPWTTWQYTGPGAKQSTPRRGRSGGNR